MPSYAKIAVNSFELRNFPLAQYFPLLSALIYVIINLYRFIIPPAEHILNKNYHKLKIFKTNAENMGGRQNRKSH